jgi:hypothetical protein
MALKDIEQDLQRRDSEVAKREHKKTVYDVWQSKEGSSPKKDSRWQKIKDEMGEARTKAILAGVFVVIFCIIIIVISAVYVNYKRSFFNKDNVSLLILTPKMIDSNVITEVSFEYLNNNRADLNDVEILVDLGGYFVPEDGQQNFKRVSIDKGIITIGTIDGHEESSFKLAGHFVGPLNAVADISGIMRYSPSNTNIRYETPARAVTQITSSPITLDIDAPNEVISGNLIDIDLIVKNTSTTKLTNIKLILNNPKTFEMQKSEPKGVNNGNEWYIDEVGARSEYVIRVRGALTAPAGTVQMFKAEIVSQDDADGKYTVYSDAKYAPTMVKPPIVMKQEILNNNNGVVYSGKNLRYKVTFTNDSDIPLRDVIASVVFDASTLDFSKLRLRNGGSYDSDKKEIVWKASDVPELKTLEPKDEAVMHFEIPVMEQLPVETKEDYNFQITTIASIDSDDIPSELRENKIILSNAMTVKVGAKIVFNTDVKYKEGQKPLKVGEKTVYSVTVTVDNINNDLSNTLVKIPLPTYVDFESGDNEELKFNKRANVVEWNIGDIEHGAGITSERRMATFDISIIPSIDQVNSLPIIIKEQVLTAKDNFTNLDVVEKKHPITTRANDQNYNMGVITK